MPLHLTWLGHSALAIDTGQHRLLVDPFLTGNALAPVTAKDVEADYILLTHAHFDHLGGTVDIAKRTGAGVIANFELSEWLKKQGLREEQVTGMNPGGAYQFPFGRVKMTIAHHSSCLPDGSYGGVPAGYLLTLGEKKVYVAGDTALFLDMKMIRLAGVELAVLPIGDLYTMGIEDSVEAVKLLNRRKVAPCHYNTWPPIVQDAYAWADEVRRQTAAEPLVLEPGKAVEI